MNIKDFNTDDPRQVFTTYDLGVSAALLCIGYKFLTLDRTNPNRVLFVFQRTKNIDTAANDYLADNLEVNARSFFDQLKAIKSRLYGRD